MKRKYLIMIFMLLFPQIVLAAPNASINTSASSIEKGKEVTVTVTLTDTAAWNIKVTGSGAATCSTKQADVTSDGKSTTKTFNLNCTSTSEGTIVFTLTGDITSGSGETKDVNLTKNVTVTKPKSGDNALSDLKVDGTTVAGFSGGQTSYTLNDNTGTSISIAATANDPKATVSGTGSKTLNYGKNSFNIVVTAENGSKKTYTINVNKPDSRSTNNNLKSLTVSKGSIDFNKNTTSYTVKLEHDVNEITISANAEDSKASVSGIGTKKLQDYINEFKIVVKAENGSEKAYTIKAIRKDKDGNYGKLSEDNSVKSISIKNYDFKFDSNTKKYNILVDENVEKLDINVVPNDAAATTSIQNNDNLKPGLNKIIVQVTAENGKVNEYTFNVYKIGEEKEEETEKPIETIGTESNNKFNIWMIIAGIEFVVIILLVVFFLLKKNNQKKDVNNKKDDDDDDDDDDETDDEELSSVELPIVNKKF